METLVECVLVHQSSSRLSHYTTNVGKGAVSVTRFPVEAGDAV